MKKILAILVMFISLSGFSQYCSGEWITIDDKTGKKKSIVKLYKKDKRLYGKIIYLYPRKGREPNAVCKKCPDDRKNKPLVGLQIIRNCKWNGEEWEDGTIIDPENGKIYDVKIWLDEDNPDILHVRGYVGPFFRTQTWKRKK